MKRLNYLQFLKRADLLRAVCAIFVLTAPVALQAQNSHYVLNVAFSDGSDAIVRLTEDMHLDFNSGQMQISTDGGVEQVYELPDVRQFSYSLATAVESAGTAAGRPVVNMSAEGVTLSLAGGPHTYMVTGPDGAILQQGDFTDSVFIRSDRFPAGVIMIQTDRFKAFKIVRR